MIDSCLTSFSSHWKMVTNNVRFLCSLQIYHLQLHKTSIGGGSSMPLVINNFLIVLDNKLF